MCNKKGFTLIELLATIVVIAIVSLISVPVVVNIIEKANLASFKRSAESIRRISKNYYTNNSLEYQDFDNIYFDCNNSECISNFNGVKYKNLGASGSMGNGYVKIYDEGDIEFLLSNGKYCAEKNISSDTIKYYKGTCEGLVIDLDKIKINSIETISTTSTITVRGDVTAGKSGVAQYEFYIDNELKYIEETTDTNYTYTFTKVSGKNHTIKVKVYNGTHGKPNEDLNSSSDEKEINASLLDFENIKIIPSTTEWASSKTYTISGTTAGATLQYKLVSGTTVKQDWTNYSGDITVNWTSTTTNPTYIYARFNDGVNTSDEKTNIETKIDTTAPVLTLGTATPTTKSITIPITVNKDDESGIKSTKCEYGTSTSYGNIGTISGNSCVINNVKNNTKYYYKVATTNNAGLSTVKTGSNETGQFGAITIVSSSTEWASSKTYTISGTTTGATLQYKVVSGTTVKQDWTNYSSAITVNWAANTTTPTYIYARFNDGVNTSDEVSYTETKIDTTAPVLTLGTATPTTKSITIPITVNKDDESGIKSTKCEYGTSTSYGNIGTISGNSCVINNVKNNTKYYYKVATTNNAGLSTVKTGSNETGQFGAITIVSSSTEWASSKTYTISGTTTGATLQYKVVSGTTVKQDWTNYSGDITVNWTSTITTPTYIYARFNDGTNTSDEKTYIETKIDTTAPVATVVYKTADGQVYESDNWTNQSVTAYLSAIDNESGLDHYQMTYDGATWIDIAGDTFTFENSGRTGMWFRAVDKVGNIGGQTTTYLISIDKTNPTITYNYNAQSTINWYGGEYYMGCFNGGITPTLTLADTGGSGLSSNNQIAIWKDGTWINNAVSIGNNQWNIPMAEEGRYIPHIIARDNAGNVSQGTRPATDENHLTVWEIDTSTPTMSVNFNGYTPGTWTNGNIAISLSGSNSGCDTTKNYYYSINDGEWVHFGTGDTATYNITSDANYNIKFVVTDGWGRWGTLTQNYSIKRDTIKPTVSYSLAGGTYSTNQIVRITPSDANYSSMAVHVYKNSALVYSGKVDEKSTDGTSALYYDVALDSDGTWTIYTTVYDKAGNTQNQSPNNGWWYYQEYTISTTKLQVLNGLNIDNGWVGDANNINLQANCPSGVTNYVFDIYDLNYPDRIATTKTVGSTATSITYLFTSNLSEMTYPFPATDHYGQPITINQKFKGSLKINLSCKNASGTTIASTSRTVQIDTTPVLSLYSANATTTSFDAVISIKNLGSGINHVYYAKGHGTTESLDNGTSTTRTFTGFTSCSYHYITAHVINNVGLTGSISTYLWTEGCSGGSGSGTCSCSTAQSILKCVSDNGTNCGGDSRTAASILQSCKSQGITCSY